MTWWTPTRRNSPTGKRCSGQTIRVREIQFTFADMKRETDRTASYFQRLGIGKGDVVMLILKRRYEFWFSILALHKLGAVVIPATHLLTKKDVVYRCNTAGIKAIVAAGERVITDHVAAAMPESRRPNC